jgi:hypothetical protein
VLNLLIRVQLPDRPGALGAVASRIGSVGADVVSIDILQRSGGIVVDELGVVLAGDHLVKLLRDEILEVDGVTVESMRPVEGPLPDRYAELLDVATDLFKHAPSGGLLEQLVLRVRRSLSATYVAVLRTEGATVVASEGALPDHGELVALASRAAAPGSDPAGRDHLAVGTDADPAAAQAPVSAAVAMVHSGLVLVVGRTDPVLRTRELQWISIIAELADHGWLEPA